MNCQELSIALDERGYLALDARERAALERHAAACSDCAAALFAARALALERVPSFATPPDWAAIVRAAGPRKAPRPSSTRRLSRTAALAAIFGVGGAVLAAAGHLLRPAPDAGDAIGNPPPAAGAGAPTTEAPPTEPSLAEYVEHAEREAHEAFAASLMDGPLQPDGEYFKLLIAPPAYPPAAAAAGLEGWVVVEFTVTAAGNVDDVQVVESSDPVFEASAIDAARRNKYKPRIAGGRAVDVTGVRNRFAFTLDVPPELAPPSAEPTAQPTPGLPSQAFDALLAPAYACLQTNDLRCVELTLDEAATRPELDAAQRMRIASIYGFVHHRRGDLQRALEAYQLAAAEAERAAHLLEPFYLSTVARIHYEQHQYQAALDAAIEYLQKTPRPIPADYVFVDRLRQLGAVVR